MLIICVCLFHVWALQAVSAQTLLADTSSRAAQSLGDSLTESQETGAKRFAAATREQMKSRLQAASRHTCSEILAVVQMFPCIQLIRLPKYGPQLMLVHVPSDPISKCCLQTTPLSTLHMKAKDAGQLDACQRSSS